MRQATLKALYDLHSWIGVTVGLLLYVVCFSGVIALFDAELGPWERGEPRLPVTAAGARIDAAVAWTIDAMRQADGPAIGRNFLILLPTPWQPAVTTQFTAGTPRARHLVTLDPDTGLERPERAAGPNELLNRLHTDLLLPQPVGRYLVAALGLLMLVSVVSGVILHRKPIADLFTLRTNRSRRLLWTDLHKSAGLWGLPFHFVMALTGVVLGVAGFAVAIAGIAAFDGDFAAMQAALGSAGRPPAGVPAPMLQASVLLERAVAALPGFEPEVMIASGYGDAAGVVEFLGNRDGALVYYISVALDAATGEVLGITDWSREGFGRRIYAMATPLHYASYGGLAVKVLYAILGAGTCLIIVTGVEVWLSRPGAASTRSRRVLPDLACGVFFGLPAATAALFWLHRPLQLAPTMSDRAVLLVFLAMWVAALVWPRLRGSRRAGRELMLCTGGLLVSQPLLTLALSGRLQIPAGTGFAPVFAADIVAPVLGAALLHRAWARRPGGV